MAYLLSWRFANKSSIFAPLLLVTSVALNFQYTESPDDIGYNEQGNIARQATAPVDDVIRRSVNRPLPHSARRSIAGYGLVLLVGFLAVRYMVLDQMNAQDFVTVYKGDVAQLRQIERRVGISADGTGSQIVVANPAGYLRSYDPYKIRFLNGDAKASVFHTPWSVA